MGDRQRQKAPHAQVDGDHENRIRDRRQESMQHEVRIERQRHDDVLEGPCECHDSNGNPGAPRENLNPRDEISVVGHLLGETPDDRPDQHGVECGDEWQRLAELRATDAAVNQKAAGRDAAEDEEKTGRDQCEAEQDIAAEPVAVEADQIEQPDALVPGQPPEQCEAACVDQGPIDRKPCLGVFPGRRRSVHRIDRCDHALRGDGESGSPEQQHERTGPQQQMPCVPIDKSGMGVRICRSHGCLNSS